MNVLPMCIKAGLHILSCLLLLKGKSTFLEVPAMHRKEPASRDVLPARTSLYHVVMQRSHPHGKTWRRDPANTLFARSFMQQGPEVLSYISLIRNFIIFMMMIFFCIEGPVDLVMVENRFFILFDLRSNCGILLTRVMTLIEFLFDLVGFKYKYGLLSTQFMVHVY